MDVREHLRSLGFGSTADSGVIVAAVIRFYLTYPSLDTVQVCAYVFLVGLLSVVFIACSDLSGHLNCSRMGKWWRQSPYMLNKSSRFMSTFIELIQDRKWKVICKWLTHNQCIHQMLLLDRSQQTVLHHAILYRAPANVIAAILNKAPSLASVQNDLGEAALHWAVRLEANREILSLLLKANPGAGVYCRDHNNITPLWLLWDRKTRTMSTDTIVQMFREYPATWRRIEMMLDPPRGPQYHRRDSTSSLLHKVAGYPTPAGIFAVVYNMYREKELAQDILGRTPLMVACSSVDANESYDDITKIQFLLSQGPLEVVTTPNHEGRLPLHIALQSGIRFGKGLEELVRLDRGDAFRRPDPVTNLPLFCLPTVGACCKADDTQSLDTAYRLLRHDPSQLQLLI